MSKIKLTVILGTDREGSFTLKLAPKILEHVEKLELYEITLVEPSKIEYGYNVENKEYAKIVEESDAFFIITPEYNHSYPGVLKTILDMQDSAYRRKPVAIAAVSDGVIGGARCIEALTSPLKALGLIMIRPDINVFRVDKILDENGEITDQKLIERIPVVMEELHWHAKVLKVGRESTN